MFFFLIFADTMVQRVLEKVVLMKRGSKNKEYGALGSEPRTDELETDTAIALEGEEHTPDCESKKEASPLIPPSHSISSTQIFGVLFWIAGFIVFMTLEGARAGVPLKLGLYLCVCAIELSILKFWTLDKQFGEFLYSHQSNKFVRFVFPLA